MPSCFSVCNSCGQNFPNRILFRCEQCGSSDVEIDKEVIPKVYEDIDEVENEDDEENDDNETEYE